MAKIIELPVRRSNALTEGQGFYSAIEAARIARLPRQQVYAWKREGIIIPRIVWTDDEEKTTLGYSFEALVYLRLLRLLREERKPLEKAVRCLQSLQERFGPPGPSWADVRIFTQAGDVFVEQKDDDWGVTAATRHGQKVATILFGQEFEDLRQRADALLVPRKFRDTVIVDPDIRTGYPVIQGTTLETRLPYQLREAGQNERAIRDAYPILTLPQIKGAIRYERLLDAEAA